MKSVLLAAIFYFLLPASLWAQDIGMEEAMKLAQPGPSHEMLKSLEGTYDLTFNYWMVPGEDPFISKGTLENKMILGGRFLESKSFIDMMGEMKHGMQILGYDNRIGKHTFYGFDEFGTFAFTAEGDYDESAKTITYFGTDSLSTSGKQMNYKLVMSMGQPDGYTFEVFFQGKDGNFKKEVEVILVRKP